MGKEIQTILHGERRIQYWPVKIPLREKDVRVGMYNDLDCLPPKQDEESSPPAVILEGVKILEEKDMGRTVSGEGNEDRDQDRLISNGRVDNADKIGDVVSFNLVDDPEKYRSKRNADGGYHASSEEHRSGIGNAVTAGRVDRCKRFCE